MNAVLAAGASCDGSMAHLTLAWAVDTERKLHLLDVKDASIRPELRHALACAIPGEQAVLAVDARRLFALLDDGSVLRLDERGNPPRWRPFAEPVTEAHRLMGTQAEANAGPTILAAGTACSGFWYLDRARRVWAWTSRGISPVGEAPLPGEARIMACDPAGQSVVLGDGWRLAWTGGCWSRMGHALHGSAGTLKVRVRDGFAAGAPFGDLSIGDVVDMPESMAREALRRGRVELLDEDAA